MEHCRDDLQEVGEREMTGGMEYRCYQGNQEVEVQQSAMRGVGVKICPQKHLTHTQSVNQIIDQR